VRKRRRWDHAFLVVLLFSSRFRGGFNKDVLDRLEGVSILRGSGYLVFFLLLSTKS